MTDFPELDATDVNAPDPYLELKRLHAAHNAAALAAKKAKSAYEIQRDKVYEMMEEEGTESIRRHGKMFVRNEPTWYATVQDKAQLVKWLEENRPSALGDVKLDEAILNRIARSCVEDNRSFPPGMAATPRRIVAVRK